MTIMEQLNESVRVALLDGQKERLLTLRGIRAEIIFETKKFPVGTYLTEEQTLSVVAREKKKFEEALMYAKQAQRVDLIEGAHASLNIVNEFLPEQLTEEAVSALIIEIFETESPFTVNSTGQIMKLLSPRIKVKYDGKKASELVKSLIGGYTR